jgi:predicted glutamine amidotransferase
MCRLFGLSAGRTPVTATFWLLDAPDSLRQQSHREPDGTGLGYFDEKGAAHVDKQPLAAFADRSFAREARSVHASTFVAHIRYASTGGLEMRNTHPFEQQGRLFAHNGVLTDLPALEARVGERMNLVHGDTDSERLFALITAEAERAQGDVETGIEAAITWVAANLPVLSLNFVLLAPGELWALRYPDTHELHVLQREPGRPLDQTSSHGTRVHSDHGADRDTVVVASEVMDHDPNWRELGSGELIHVTPELEVTSRIVLDAPPRRRLSLADLEGRARSSQS